MRLTVVGCSGSYPGPESAASCYLLESQQHGRTWRVLLDAGSGSLGPLHKHIDPLDVDAIFVSHLHPDHYFDLSGHYVLRKYHPAGHQPRIPVWGPPGIARRLALAYGLPEDPGMSAEFDFHEYAGTPVVMGPFTVTPSRVRHPVVAYGLRVAADGALLAYTGDTGPGAEVVALAQGADVLLAEAAFQEGDDNPRDLHLTGKDAGDAAAAAGVGLLLLTHIPAWNDRQRTLTEATKAFDGRVELVSPGSTYAVADRW